MFEAEDRVQWLTIKTSPIGGGRWRTVVSGFTFGKMAGKTYQQLWETEDEALVGHVTAVQMMREVWDRCVEERGEDECSGP